MILRVFEVRARAGRIDELRQKLSDTSVSVVKGQPGNRGYLFGDELSIDGSDLVFISVWKDMEAVQARFGERWNESYLPDGYEELIDSHGLKHFSVRGEVDPAAFAESPAASGK